MIDREKVKKKVKRIIAEEFNLDRKSIKGKMWFSDFDIDEDDLESLAETLEDEFNIDDLDEDDVQNCDTINELVDLLIDDYPEYLTEYTISSSYSTQLSPPVQPPPAPPAIRTNETREIIKALLAGAAIGFTIIYLSPILMSVAGWVSSYLAVHGFNISAKVVFKILMAAAKGEDLDEVARELVGEEAGHLVFQALKDLLRL